MTNQVYTDLEKEASDPEFDSDIQQHVFHFNPYMKRWACVHRDFYMQYLNGDAPYNGVVYAESLHSLLSMFVDDHSKKESTEKS